MDNLVMEYSILEDNVRNTFASIVWSHKIQEKQADIIWKKYRYLETIKIVCASLTSVGIVSMIFTDMLWVKIISTLLSFVTIFISAFYKSFDLRTMVYTHKDVANELLMIREQFKLLLMNIKLKTKSVKELSIEYSKLEKLLSDIYFKAPITTDKAVKKAEKALYYKNDDSYSEDEINNLLPKSLWKREMNNEK